ncbi:Protein of unknown function, partial [Gryllus bimaculatus]
SASGGCARGCGWRAPRCATRRWPAAWPSASCCACARASSSAAPSASGSGPGRRTAAPRAARWTRACCRTGRRPSWRRRARARWPRTRPPSSTSGEASAWAARSTARPRPTARTTTVSAGKAYGRFCFVWFTFIYL